MALVGPSGSGKTTVVSLILRLYDPQRGTIFLNGVPLNQYSLQELRGNFGVVPQDPFIFQGTLRDNIRVTQPDATARELNQAIEMSYVSEFIDQFPQREKTYVGEGGFNLSGGQKQRIAIARALLAKPRYYIFDEATSALDNQSEQFVQRAMGNVIKDHTAFIIAHRLSTIRHVDRVLVFDQGKIVQDGRYATLARQPGLFKKLLRSARSGSKTSAML